MPPGSKKRKAAKKKKQTELHVQTASIASPEESGNEHEDVAQRAQAHGQVSEEGGKDGAPGVESGSPIYRTDALNREAFAEKHTEEISVEQDCPVESLDGDRVESKVGVEPYEGEPDKNVSIQKVGSQELSGSIQTMGARRVSDQKTTNGLVELSLAEAEYESEFKKSLYQEGRSGADSLKLESGLIPVGGVHTDVVECQEDQGGYAICDSVARSGLDDEESTDLKDTRGFKEGPVTEHQELSRDADSLKLELPDVPASVVHEPVKLLEEQDGQGINASLAHPRLGSEASSQCEDTQGLGEGFVTLHRELSGDADSLKLEAAEFQEEQAGHGTNGILVHSSLDGESRAHFKNTCDLVQDPVMPHGELSFHSDSPKLSPGSPVSVVPTGVVEVQQEQEGHAADHSSVHSGFEDTGDVGVSVMPCLELSIHADSPKSEPDGTPVSVVHTEIVDFEHERADHDISGSFVHSRLDGEASTHSEDTGNVGEDSVKPHGELSSDADALKVESDVTPVHTEVVEFHQEQEGHGIDSSLVLSRLDGEASTNCKDTKDFVKNSVKLHQELSVVDSPKKLGSAAPAFYVVRSDIFEIPQEKEQGLDVNHSLIHSSSDDEAGNQFKYMKDFAKEVSSPASVEKDFPAHGDGVLPNNRLSDIKNKVEDTNITSLFSLLPTEKDTIVTEEGDSSLEFKIDKPTVAMAEHVISSSKEVSRNDSDTHRAVGGDAQTSLHERDMDVTLHYQNTANQAVSVRRGLLASWKSCCGFLELLRGSRS